MNLLLFIIFFRFSSKPIENKRKYIPSWAKNMKVSEDVTSVNGLYAESPRPINSGANTHGTLIFSNIIPTK